jgi:hypothetical protein
VSQGARGAGGAARGPPRAPGDGVAMHELPLLPRDCPRFEKCNAAVCPLAPDWRQAASVGK